MYYTTSPQYANAKGSCYVCGSVDSGIDFEAPIEYEGDLFVCTACIAQAVTEIPNAVDHILARAAAAENAEDGVPETSKKKVKK